MIFAGCWEMAPHINESGLSSTIFLAIETGTRSGMNSNFLVHYFLVGISASNRV